jgi:hypothetical protein
MLGKRNWKHNKFFCLRKTPVRKEGGSKSWGGGNGSTRIFLVGEKFLSMNFFFIGGGSSALGNK